MGARIARTITAPGRILHWFIITMGLLTRAFPDWRRLGLRGALFAKTVLASGRQILLAETNNKSTPPRYMKLLPTLSCASLALVLTSLAQVKETTTETTQTRNPDGSVSETTTTTTHFNPEAQTKLVQYFDTYKTSPNGLPPDWATQMKIKQIPPAWRTTRLAPGTVLTQENRAFLMDAPPALVKVLPAASADVHYYVAGGNVVAVDKTYKVVDSIRIPSIKFDVEVDDDGDEIKIKRKEKDD